MDSKKFQNYPHATVPYPYSLELRRNKKYICSNIWHNFNRKTISTVNVKMTTLINLVQKISGPPFWKDPPLNHTTTLFL